MRISDITVDVCVSALQGYEFDPSDSSKDLILDVNRYKKYIRLYVLNKHIGYLSKRDAPLLLNTLKSMNRHVRVSEWSLVMKTQHYLILKLHLCSYKNYKYYIYQLSFPFNDMYIGSTKNLPIAHKKQLKNKTHVNHLLQRAFDKYSNDMEVNILFSAETNDIKQNSFKKNKSSFLSFSLHLILSALTHPRQGFM